MVMLLSNMLFYFEIWPDVLLDFQVRGDEMITICVSVATRNTAAEIIPTFRLPTLRLTWEEIHDTVYSPAVETPSFSSSLPWLAVSHTPEQTGCLHAQFSRITAIVRLCYSIRQLLLSEYTCRWENGIIGIGLYPFQLVVTETPPADLFTSPATTNCLGIR